MPDGPTLNVEDVVVSTIQVKKSTMGGDSLEWPTRSHCEPRAYSVVQRTDPQLISRFTNPGAPVQYWTAPRPNREYPVTASDHR
jgi:hypothetical protein